MIPRYPIILTQNLRVDAGVNYGSKITLTGAQGNEDKQLQTKMEECLSRHGIGFVCREEERIRVEETDAVEGAKVGSLSPIFLAASNCTASSYLHVNSLQSILFGNNNFGIKNSWATIILLPMDQFQALCTAFRLSKRA
jgi:hypothetical protein